MNLKDMSTAQILEELDRSIEDRDDKRHKLILMLAKEGMKLKKRVAMLERRVKPRKK